MNQMLSWPRLARVGAMFALACALLPVSALAELMLNPTRVVLTKNQRAAQVELINNSAEPATYRITMVNRRMGEGGEFVDVAEAGPGEQFADAMLTWSPRQITLQPGTAQVVRLMVRKPEGLAEGEYRSHLHFEKLANPGDLASSVEAGAGAEAKIGVVLKTLIGASIPVIVRHGASAASVALTGLAMQPREAGKAPVLAFALARSGNSSVYGDLSVTLVTRSGAEHELARAGGVAVYTPNLLRRASLSLQAPAGVALSSGQLRLAYRERPEAGGKLLAEATLVLP
ncbi:MAG: molecular chaperone [Massilia sp.]|nr:molecular chaperone [Massilia sp.]